MQVTDAMVAAAIEAYAATDSHTVLLDGNAMRAAITAALAEMWRPIEEAPTNGTEHAWPYITVLVVDDVGVTQADFKGEDGWWPANLDSEYGSRIYPTHFMPLPEPPPRGK